MINEVILSRLDELIGEFDTPFFKYLLYSYDLTLRDCELVISKLKSDISDGIVSSDDNLVEVVEEYFRGMCLETEKRGKMEYLASLINDKSDFYRKFLAKYDVSSKDIDVIYTKIETRIAEDNISDYEIKRSLEYYFSNAVKQDSYIRSLEMIVGRNYDALTVTRIKREYPNIYIADIISIANELYGEILDGKNFKSIKNAFFDKVMRKSEAKKAEAISKWDSLVLGNGDSFNKLLETKKLTIDDGEAIKRDVRSKILNGLLCADRIDGAFLTRLCINYSSE
ncbi:hypothetical protein [uncultured Methanobrevibacter sp.]|uniref:hypothetical protein n=1 Tax=uncultured Methanobrevibacter sp. TaxID=253161 RepID=UPI0025EE765C|nr:hypothetical protein [uncultured Methanobrevibacter sp.]